MFSGSWSATGVSNDSASPGDPVRIEGHAKSGSIVIPDADLLFSGDFKRSGLDLEISRDDRHFLVRDYFKGEHRAGLASPDGAWLTGDIVNALLALGYNDKEAAWAVKQLPVDSPVAEGIRQALKLLSKS